MEDVEDLFLCRSISIETILTYFNCSYKDLLPDDISFITTYCDKGNYFSIHLNNQGC